MPKEGLSEKDWKQRLQNFADGTFHFSTGRHTSNKRRQEEYFGVKNCPAHNRSQKIGVDGKPIICKCGYHKKKKQNIPVLIPKLNKPSQNVPKVSTSTPISPSSVNSNFCRQGYFHTLECKQRYR
uniref:Uncharacterized protein n=1 Tax=Clytia hemisphaerica TaxID=252671 RepID=A0A7M5WTY9_9CNID